MFATGLGEGESPFAAEPRTRTLHPEMGLSIASKGDIDGRISPQLVLSIAMSLGVVMHEWMAPLRSAYMADT